MAERYAPTARTRIRRLPKRAHYDRAAVHAVLDAGVMCHVGYVIDEQPYVTPTLYWRDGERLYWHGSSASRMLRHLQRGVRACVTVAHFDGLVLARSGFHHSVNYRSVMALGTASLVPDEDKLGVLEDFVEHILPGRWPELRPPTPQEIKATTVLWMDLEEVSAKIRTGQPIDDEEDYALPIWAGVVPVRTTFGAPEPDPRLISGTPMPAYLERAAGGLAWPQPAAPRAAPDDEPPAGAASRRAVAVDAGVA
ncbi:MAG: flavin-nucleotide-binding protein [Geminicoccaceae bacterium]|jgi:nitroimidazol reductase NimA-like FMN-containing flavoprotein (pyridoxamine 5'-phosphate oxidase superfamily)|nr:flavin-nucleotide-binding protein [Geminicoccaceae bacterium]MCE3246744.1 flavin-nucleotide-binding protein [Geminicoccaceae bacterium]